MRSAVLGALCAGLLGLAPGAGCAREKPPPPTFGPVIDGSLVPPAFGGRVIGESTFGEASLAGAFVQRDVRFGGRSGVGWNGRPALVVIRDVPDAAGYVVRETARYAPTGPPGAPEETPLAELDMTIDPRAGASLCAWADATLGADEAASDCADAHREAVRSDARSVYCLGTPDARAAVAVTCIRDVALDGSPRERIRYERVTLR